jgi:hypothetical protein
LRVERNLKRLYTPFGLRRFGGLAPAAAHPRCE